MSACPYEFFDGKGHDICTLSGRQCFIDHQLERPSCTRWLKTHQPTGENKDKKREPFMRVKLAQGDRIMALFDLDPYVRPHGQGQ